MRKKIKKVGLITLGVFTVIFGLIAGPLPILPGFIFILLGLLIISIEYPILAEWLEKTSRKNKKMETWYKKAIGKLEQFFKIDK